MVQQFDLHVVVWQEDERCKRQSRFELICHGSMLDALVLPNLLNLKHEEKHQALLHRLHFLDWYWLINSAASLPNFHAMVTKAYTVS